MNFLVVALFTITLVIVVNGQYECAGNKGQDAIRMGKTLLNGFCQVSLPNTDKKGRCVRINMVDIGTNNILGAQCINEESSNEICAGGKVNEDKEEYRKASCCMGRVVQKEGYRHSFQRILNGCEEKQSRQLSFESELESFLFKRSV